MLIGQLGIHFMGCLFKSFAHFSTVTNVFLSNIGEKEIFTYLDITPFIGLGYILGLLRRE